MQIWQKTFLKKIKKKAVQAVKDNRTTANKTSKLYGIHRGTLSIHLR